MTTLHLDQTELFAKHRANLLASLDRRLLIARAMQNTQLVAQLEEERRQLDREWGHHSGWSNFVNWFQTVTQKVQEAINSHSELSVDRIQDESGFVLWRAYDPQSGKTLYAESQSEVVKWIEDNGLGH
ncbi:MAG: hypothetical protein SFW36_02960 [Leptolyngbyaceae cyanobacterium bins.59]|nr:hypothetical protein [Leptolyngbyaceae cyanobacterium bins.59]